MTERKRTWLELDLSGEGIVGRLHEDDRQPYPFAGWLELVAALEEARARNAATTTQPATPKSAPADTPAARQQRVEPSTLLDESETSEQS